ncbi:MAG: hypothetical protein JXQ96_07150 [Cyclobacteriaceae bacterium]
MKIKFIVLLIAVLISDLFLTSSYCQESIPEDIPLISYRIFPAQYESDEQFSRLLEFLKEYPDAVDEIALMDENFPGPAGLPLEAVEKLAERLEKRIPELRQAGIRSVGINVAHTLGHWDVPGMDYTPLPPEVGHDGTQSLTCMCHNSPEFREYIQKKYSLMAGTGTNFIWVDDDFRAHYRGQRYPCFCSICLQKFGRDKERVDLVAKLNMPENVGLRRDWTEFIAASHEGLARDIRAAVQHVDPEVELGLMTIGYSISTYGGYPIHRWMRAMGASRGRPGHGFYTDDKPRMIINKALDVARQVRDYPSGVKTIAYELENSPYITLDKSVRTMINECTLALMMGCNGFALNVLNRYEGSLEDFHPRLQAITAERSRWKTLVESSAGLPLTGFWPADHPMLMSNRIVDEKGWFFEGGAYNIQAPNQIFEMGIPFAADSRHAFGTILSGKLAEVFTTEELRDMLSKSVILDVFALDVLWERGLGELTGVKPGGDVQLGYGSLQRVAVTERFTRHPLNGPDAGFVREAYTAIPERPGTLVPVAEGVIDLSRLIRHDGTDLGSCYTLYTNELGGRVAVSSYSPWTKIGLGPKRRQLIAVADWLSAGRLPLIIDETVRVAPFVRQSEDGRVVVVLFNTSLDATGALTLRLRAKPQQVSLVSAKGFELLKTRVSEEETVVAVPSIPPWKTVTLMGY